jgi:hypothetical protein
LDIPSFKSPGQKLHNPQTKMMTATRLAKSSLRRLQEDSASEEEVYVPPPPCTESISNDGPIIDCQLPRFYGPCGVTAVEGLPASTTHVMLGFDYELYYQGTALPMEYLEGIVLEHLATAYDLNDCDDDPNSRHLKSAELIAMSGSPNDQPVPGGKSTMHLL